MAQLKKFLVLLILATALPSYADDRGELVLFKEPLFPHSGGNIRGFDADCNDLFYVQPDRDVPDLRDFRKFFCAGKYTLTLDGPPGKIATVFGDFDFKTGYGFLALRKTDGGTVWLLDLEQFPPGRWTAVPPSGQYGGFEVYYRAAPGFAQNVASIKWGKWWGRLEGPDSK
ncbi:MAG: hypothetical protein HY579_08840 [Nitrospinae bacterium]|nr:hypothetical protein [Nitrospinota bacterium]